MSWRGKTGRRNGGLKAVNDNHGGCRTKDFGWYNEKELLDGVGISAPREGMMSGGLMNRINPSSLARSVDLDKTLNGFLPPRLLSALGIKI